MGSCFYGAHAPCREYNRTCYITDTIGTQSTTGIAPGQMLSRALGVAATYVYRCYSHYNVSKLLLHSRLVSNSRVSCIIAIRITLEKHGRIFSGRAEQSFNSFAAFNLISYSETTCRYLVYFTYTMYYVYLEVHAPCKPASSSLTVVHVNTSPSQCIRLRTL